MFFNQAPGVLYRPWSRLYATERLWLLRCRYIHDVGDDDDVTVCYHGRPGD